MGQNKEKKVKGFTLLDVLIAVVVAAILFLGLFRGAFADSRVAMRALETQGYSNVQITNHQWFLVGFRGCDEKDAAKFSATAMNPVGRQVELFVCTGWIFKGATVRTR